MGLVLEGLFDAVVYILLFIMISMKKYYIHMLCLYILSADIWYKHAIYSHYMFPLWTFYTIMSYIVYICIYLLSADIWV